jgi:hypothetical protein
VQTYVATAVLVTSYQVFLYLLKRRKRLRILETKWLSIEDRKPMVAQHSKGLTLLDYESIFRMALPSPSL